MVVPKLLGKAMENNADDWTLTLDKSIGRFEKLFEVICIICAFLM